MQESIAAVPFAAMLRKSSSAFFEFFMCQPTRMLSVLPKITLSIRRLLIAIGLRVKSALFNMSPCTENM
jgi:hypothetical protein